MVVDKEGDSVPKGLLRAAAHLEDFAAAYVRTLGGCLSGALVLPHGNHTVAAIPPVVFLLVAHALSFATFGVLLAHVGGKSLNLLLQDSGVQMSIAGYYGYSLLAVGSACLLLAVLMGAKPLDRLSFGILFGAIAAHHLEEVFRDTFGRWWLRWAIALAASALLFALVYEEEEPANEKPEAPDPTKPTFDQPFWKWALWWYRNASAPAHARNDDFGKLTRLGKRAVAGTGWALVSPRGWLASVTLVVACIFFWFSSMDLNRISGNSEQPSSDKIRLGMAVFGAGCLFVAWTTFLSLKNVNGDRLRRATYQMGWSLWSMFAQMPLFTLGIFAAGKRPQLATGILTASFVVSLVLSWASARVRSKPGYAGIVMIAALGALGVSASVLDAWALADHVVEGQGK